MTKDGSTAQMSATWHEAGQELGIKVIAPFDVAGASFVAYLRDFGGPQGMVIARLSSQTDGETTAASDAGFYLSRVSDDYAEFDRRTFQSALDDWGWFGPDDLRPDWYTGEPWAG